VTPDAVDQHLLARLGRDGRASWVDLARELRLTPPAVAARVRRLVDAQIIRHFNAWISPRAMGVLTAFVDVNLPDDPKAHEEFRHVVGRLLAIQECHRIAGTAQYLLKVRARSREELNTLLTAVLPKATRGVPLRVSMVLTSIKESPVFPLPRPSPNQEV
jgi:Lrp/AsnC family leucine-responsive transcriptional regulator